MHACQSNNYGLDEFPVFMIHLDVIGARMRPDRCPVVVSRSPSCSEDQCQLDMDCKDGTTCCFDGCSNQCLIDVNPDQSGALLIR